MTCICGGLLYSVNIVFNSGFGDQVPSSPWCSRECLDEKEEGYWRHWGAINRALCDYVHRQKVPDVVAGVAQHVPMLWYGEDPSD